MSSEQKPAAPPAPAPRDPILENLIWLQRTREKRLYEAREDRRR
ncbi:hypothetical protein ACH4K8_20525 [Streptomyces anulatus]